MSLTTSFHIICCSWTTLPVSDNVILWVHKLVENKDFDCLAKSPLFKYAPGIPVTDSDEEQENNPISLVDLDIEGAPDLTHFHQIALLQYNKT